MIMKFREFYGWRGLAAGLGRSLRVRGAQRDNVENVWQEKGPRAGPPGPSRRPKRRFRALAWAAGSMGRPRWGSFGASGPESKSAGVNGPARGSLRAAQRGAPSEADAPVGLRGADVQSVSRGRSCRPHTYPRAGTTWLLVLRGPGSASRAASLRGCALARCGTAQN